MAEGRYNSPELAKKAILAGADAVMLGTPFAQSAEAPGRGYNWGMAGKDSELPRGTRVGTGTTAPLDQIINGPRVDILLYQVWDSL